MQHNVLVIAAHPDDEVLGCGGTIARHAAEGDRVAIAIVGEGITSRYTQRSSADRTLVEALHARSRQVAGHLGAAEVFLLGLPDNRFDSIPLLDVIKVVEDLIRKLRPNVIYTHHPGDLNIDHVVLHRAVLTATRPTGGCPVKDVYAFEVPSSTEWAFGQTEPVFRPNVFVEIADKLQTKIDAMQLYESEARLFPHPRSPEALQAIARRWGSVAGLQAAEAFALVRSVR
jgi:LmbE family N-acetylglucosaminyl deacetylase